MLSCWRWRYRHHCINSLVSVHLSPLLRCSYVAAARVAHTPKPRPAPRIPSPYQPSTRDRPLLDMVALKDPVKLADNVRRRLWSGDLDGARALTRDASRVMNPVVSWNHIIGYHLDCADIKNAFKAFNDMKKRGISPDSHTFTLILNCLSNYTHFNQSLSRALQLYNSLSSSKSPVSPNVFHTNAVLKVCVRADDLDSVWNIIGALPAKGPNAPNTMTYTILLNGISTTRDDTIGVEDARRVWAGVLSRSNRGQLSIDEELTCAMGRVFLASKREGDWKEVFTLCENIFGIESLVAKEPKKPVTKDTIFAEGTNNQLPSTPPGVPKTVDTEVPKSNTGTIFAPVVTTHSSTRPVPTNSTLSLILKACSLLKDEALASKYWDKFTNKPYSVEPDLENYHDRLRIFRLYRLGTEALKLVESMRVSPSHKTFFIAMSSCKRHGRSNAFNAAEKLLELMVQRHGLMVDIKVWNMFLQCALKTGVQSYIKKALRRIDEELDMEVELVKRRNTKPVYVERALELVRSMVGAIDVLMLGGEKLGVTWGHGERAVFEVWRKGLGGLVTRYGAGAKRRAYKIEMEGEDLC